MRARIGMNHNSFLLPGTTLLAFGMFYCLVAPLRAASPQGVPNFQTVNGQVYRGGQPSLDGWRNLAKLGIKTIVDLREEDDDRKVEKKAAADLGMNYINIPMRGMSTPDKQKISQALKILNDEGAGPVFVHCRKGMDRTGVVVAVYRMEHDSWDNSKALKEARSLGMAWYEWPLHRYVLAYQRGKSSGGEFAATVR